MWSIARLADGDCRDAAVDVNGFELSCVDPAGPGAGAEPAPTPFGLLAASLSSCTRDVGAHVPAAVGGAVRARSACGWRCGPTGLAPVLERHVTVAGVGRSRSAAAAGGRGGLDAGDAAARATPSPSER